MNSKSHQNFNLRCLLFACGDSGTTMSETVVACNDPVNVREACLVSSSLSAIIVSLKSLVKGDEYVAFEEREGADTATGCVAKTPAKDVRWPAVEVDDDTVALDLCSRWCDDRLVLDPSFLFRFLRLYET